MNVTYLTTTLSFFRFLRISDHVYCSVSLYTSRPTSQRGAQRQERLGSLANVITARDALAYNSTVEDELFQSACVVFVYTQDSEKHLDEGAFDFDKEYVVFDGSIVKAFLEQDEVIQRVITVHFGWRPDKWLYDKLPKRIFHVSETLELSANPKVEQLADTIKGIVKKKK